MAGAIIHKHVDHTQEVDESLSLDLYDNVIFMDAIKFVLIVCLPALIDLILSFCLLRRYDNLCEHPRECALLYLLTIFMIPNFLIYLQVMPREILDFIMFAQYVCIFYGLVYRIYTLSTTLKIVPLYPLREIMLSVFLTILSAFLYKLSVHHILPHSEEQTFKAIYTFFLFTLHIITCFFKLRPWFNITWQMSQVVKNHHLLQNKTAFYAVMSGILVGCVITVVHLATYDLSYVFFPQTGNSYIVLEWLFGALCVIWTATRSFEIKKSNLATLVRVFQEFVVF
jgi:hypothetical protein